MIATLAAALADGAGLLPPRVSPSGQDEGATFPNSELLSAGARPVARVRGARRARAAPPPRAGAAPARRAQAPARVAAFLPAARRRARAALRAPARGDAEFGPPATPSRPRSGPSRAAAAGRRREPALRRRLAVCVGLQLAQQLSGINAVVYFTPQLLKASGAAAALAGARGPRPAERRRRDPRGTRGFDPASTGAHATAAILAAAVAYAPKIPRGPGAAPPAERARGPGAAAASLAAISLYGVFFGLSLGPIPNIYTAESFPTGRDEGDSTSLQRSRQRGAAAPGGPDRTSGPSSSVASKSIRPDASRGAAPGGGGGGEVATPRGPPAAPQAAQFASHAAVSFYFPVVVARRGPRAAFAAFAAVCGVTWVFVRAAVPGGPRLEDPRRAA
ncbi:hypothetical protein JL722_14243 [Aureococcus anophagefferens]|nr:hypothetical protein JL722_14243 [Aureococcus anophagefferens]